MRGTNKRAVEAGRPGAAEIAEEMRAQPDPGHKRALYREGKNWAGGRRGAPVSGDELNAFPYVSLSTNKRQTKTGG